MEIFAEAITTAEEMNQVIQNQKLQELIEKRIEELDTRIVKDETNLKNITNGFKEMSYRLIERMVSEKIELQKLLKESEK